MSLRFWVRKAIGKPITNREHEMDKGIGSAMSYANFESVAMQASISHLPFKEQMKAMLAFNAEWGAWLDAPYEPGKVFQPSYGQRVE